MNIFSYQWAIRSSVGDGSVRFGWYATMVFMQLYLLRHGIAEDASAGMRDADRALTPEGKSKLRDVLSRAAQALVQPTLILTSPYRRARETAELAAALLKVKAPLVETDALVPQSAPEAVWEEIRTHRSENGLLLAGHEPLFSSLYSYLLGAPSVRVEVKKGSLGCLEVDRFTGAPRATLRWLLPVKLA
jgi:phosphohistidine phosphatase